jgi:hypothetical protein
MADPGQRVIEFVWVGNRHRCVGNLTGTCQPAQVGSISRGESTQDKASRVKRGCSAHAELERVALGLLDFPGQFDCRLPQNRKLAMASADGSRMEIVAKTAAHLGCPADPE